MKARFLKTDTTNYSVGIMHKNLLTLIALTFAQNSFAMDLPAGMRFSQAKQNKKVVSAHSDNAKAAASEAAPSISSSTGVVAGALAATGNLFIAMAAQAGGGDVVAMKIDKIEVRVDSNLTCSPTWNFFLKIGDNNTFCVIQ